MKVFQVRILFMSCPYFFSMVRSGFSLGSDPDPVDFNPDPYETLRIGVKINLT